MLCVTYVCEVQHHTHTPDHLEKCGEKREGGLLLAVSLSHNFKVF